jgi:hypothetical protein
VDQQQLHERILYPVTRIRAEGAGGSGVLVYSQPDSKDPKRYINLVMTCEHVVDAAIKVVEEWNAVLKRDSKIDRFQEVDVQLFDYDVSRVVSANSTKADIVAYDKRHDVAMLRLHNYRQMPYVASLYPEADIAALQVFDPVWVSGCSLLHDPFASSGEMTYLREVIEQKTYLMANAPSIFGNSGGGLFHGVDGHLLGLTSRVTALQLGFGIDVMTWMQFSTHPERLYEFFREQELYFMFDDADDYHEAMQRRERKRKASEQFLRAKDEGIVLPEPPADWDPFGPQRPPVARRE